MKDALGHGSTARGIHAAGIDKATLGPKIWSDFRDYAGGDHYGSIYADHDGNHIGHLDFVGNKFDARINMVETAPEFRRRGIATALVNKLKEEFPNAKIDWGSTTPEGTKLKRAYAKRTRR